MYLSKLWKGQDTLPDLPITTSLPFLYWSVLLLVTLTVKWVSLILMSWIARAASSLNRKNPANNSKAIEISLRIGSFLECSYSAQHAVSASGEIGDFFVTGLAFWRLALSPTFLTKGLTIGLWTPTMSWIHFKAQKLFSITEAET